jgi:hypothetical protein
MNSQFLNTAYFILVVTLFDCSFSGQATTDASPADDGVTSSADARSFDAESSPFKITHLAEADRRVGTIDMVISDAVIDTGKMTITAASTGTATTIPASDFKIVTQVGGASGLAGEVAVLYVKSFELKNVATNTTDENIDHNLRIIGSRPLIIVSATDIILDDTIDANGRGGVAGPGGHSGPSTASRLAGDGREGSGVRAGGGGGGSAKPGAVGGFDSTADQAGGAGGIASNATQSQLLGGGAGGPSTIAPQCASADNVGGPGGGGLQLFAVNNIELTNRAAITVGGGGGSKGLNCADETSFSGGAGGGAGGILFLEGSTIRLPTGSALASNGGGGGEGAGGLNSPGNYGNRGTKTKIPAAGGNSADNVGGNGGNGGADTTAPGSGENSVSGGGGGGAVGLIYLRGSVTNNGLISPEPSFI